MQPPCPHCGYTPDRPSRFCRQCGAPQAEETEASSAQTRNYGKGQPPPNYQTSNPLPNQPPAEQTPSTVRFYQPPIQQYNPAPVYPMQTPPKKSRAALWILIALLTLGMVGAGMVGMVTYAIKSRQAASTRTSPVEAPEPPEAPEAPEPPEAPEAPAPPAGATETSAAIAKFKYPGATVEKSVQTFGMDVLTMQTSDSVEKARVFYQKLAGSPMVETHEKNEHTVIFQYSGPPMLLITIKPHDEAPGKTEITILRTPIAIPKI